MNALNRDLKKLTQIIEEKEAGRILKDSYALKFHIMPKVGWLNDPNGLCQFKGKYHVFFQYSPFDEKGGLKFWGHYTSIDMIHWKNENTALYADQPFDCHGVYSGSALIDENKMYLYYTGNVKQVGKHDYVTTGREHNTVMVVSEDGKTFTHKELLMTNEDYGSEMTCHVRDPKVWKEDNMYYMVQGARDKKDRGQILLFASEDKIVWKVINKIQSEDVFGYMWECPDFFELDGQKVLLLSPQGIEADGIKYNNIYQSGYYVVEGDITTSEYALSGFEEMDRGFDFYAPQTFIDEQGRRILIGWMGLPDIDDLYSNPTTEHGWQHALTIPRELHMKEGKLIQQPIEELKNLRSKVVGLELKENNTKIQLPAHTFELELMLETLKKDLKIIIRKGAVLEYKAEEKVISLIFDECGYGRDKRSVQIEVVKNIRIFGDTSSLEIFLNDGEEVFTSRYYPSTEENQIEVEGIELNGKLNLWEMKAITIEN
ncbi:glycoside hydrolase family 32 protein [Niameybacter massiliensis]|uniref:Sucrose-6-phosphate hydrolase n=1 Tax=Holtiella tumoricola TaxID=3018743 RepID=A0AA42IZQ8_9FIRM|nr:MULTISPECIES: glycoside hydrolase family 32 protein [Lachnospirales]MDA3730293.1 glycoside hydrolase family 32 protein [Holtiella tumoricola]